jgi:hypothetical protein
VTIFIEVERLLLVYRQGWTRIRQGRFQIDGFWAGGGLALGGGGSLGPLCGSAVGPGGLFRLRLADFGRRLRKG